MTTPLGTISLNDVNVELGKSGTTLISLGASDVRGLAGVASGAISMNNLRGKSNRASISYTFSSHTANASLNLSAIGGYISGKSDITVTVNSGVYLYATSTGNYGLNITGGTTGDTLTIVNNGYIIGQGGNGASANFGQVGGNGGPALNLGFSMSSCTINNTNGSAYIAGGGGGGAADGTNNGNNVGGGGGAGGGAGGTGQGSGGSGGGLGSIGGNASSSGGGGGGRVLPGSGGSGAAGGANGQRNGVGGGAGGGGGVSVAGNKNGSGGNGGSANNAGSAGTKTSSTWVSAGAGGGGWGAAGGGYTSGGGASSGGKAVNTNGKSITWTSGDTSRIYGSVS